VRGFRLPVSGRLCYYISQILLSVFPVCFLGLVSVHATGLALLEALFWGLVVNVCLYFVVEPRLTVC